MRCLNIEGDIQRVGGCAGEFGDRLLKCGDQCGERSDDLRRGFESLVGAGEPLESIFGCDFDSFRY